MNPDVGLVGGGVGWTVIDTPYRTLQRGRRTWSGQDEGRKGGEGRGTEGGWEGKLNRRGEVWKRVIHNKVKDPEKVHFSKGSSR